MTNLNERFHRAAEATLEYKNKQQDRIEMLGANALQKLGIKAETSERIADAVSRGVALVALTAAAVGVTYGTVEVMEKGVSAVVEYTIPDPQIPNFIEEPAHASDNSSELSDPATIADVA